MITVVLFVLALALIAPALHKLLGKWTHWVLGFAVAGLTAWLASQLIATSAAEGADAVIHASASWAATLDIGLSLRGDGLSLLFAVIISGVGTLIVIYAGGYLEGHRLLGLFYAYILVFMASMLGVVLADNLIFLFVAWELTSVSSYLLIGFDHERPAARASALQAMLVTGTGGLALLAGFVLMGTIGGSYELSHLLTQGDVIREHALYLPIVILVFLGAMTKSAQFPFHFWLPNAMEAPSPVSAYLHSATMVKAGVFLLARMSPVLGGSPTWHNTLMIVGGITMLLGAALSLSSGALKRILAYSTVSVLGTLTMLIGIGTPLALQAAVLYLMAHTLYKGALFMLAGAVSHATEAYDADSLSGLGQYMPVCTVAGMLAALSMCGLPPFLGFLGKETLYEASLVTGSVAAWLTAAVVLAHMLLFVAAVRVGIRPFFGPTKPTPHAPHEVNAAMWLGPVALGAIGITAGLLAPLVGTTFVHPAVVQIYGAPLESTKLALWHGLTLALGLSAVTLAGGLTLFVLRRRLLHILRPLGALAGFGPLRAYEIGLKTLTLVAKMQTRVLQSGYLRWYLLITLTTTVGLVGYPLLSSLDPATIESPGELYHHEFVVAVLILLAAISAVRSRTRLGAVASLGTVGYGVALIYVFYGAPDLAMTQFLIETLMVILFVLVFYHLPPFASFTSRAARIRDIVVATAFGAMITVLVLAAAASRPQERVSEYFAANSYTEAHGRNVVNVILVDFRAIDTLGEITVLAVAAVGVFALYRLRRPRWEQSR